MVSIQCFNCQKEWELANSTTNRCPQCEWVVEIYYDQAEAIRVAGIYNDSQPGAQQKQKIAGVRPLKGINGYAVSFPDQDRLAEIADKLIRHEAP